MREQVLLCYAANAFACCFWLCFFRSFDRGCAFQHAVLRERFSEDRFGDVRTQRCSNQDRDQEEDALQRAGVVVDERVGVVFAHLLDGCVVAPCRHDPDVDLRADTGDGEHEVADQRSDEAVIAHRHTDEVRADEADECADEVRRVAERAAQKAVEQEDDTDDGHGAVPLLSGGDVKIRDAGDEQHYRDTVDPEERAKEAEAVTGEEAKQDEERVPDGDTDLFPAPFCWHSF